MFVKYRCPSQPLRGTRKTKYAELAATTSGRIEICFQPEKGEEMLRASAPLFIAACSDLLRNR